MGFDRHKGSSEAVIGKNDGLDAASLEKGNRALGYVGGLRIWTVLSGEFGKMVWKKSVWGALTLILYF